MIHILLVEDDDNDAILVERALQKGGGGRFVIQRVDTTAKARVALSDHEFDLILLDLKLSDSNGLETFHRIQAYSEATPIVILSGEKKTLAARALEDVLHSATEGKIARAGAYLVFSVQDTGSGIPAEIREKIFEPFFSTKDVGRGTGLGLSTTLGIVKSHSGFIDLHTEPGKGTCFKIYLPASAEPDPTQATEQAVPELPLGNGELVLVVDDEEPVREITRRTLEKYNYRAIVATNGAEAIAQYVKRSPEIAVVITDMAMPVMDGLATIHALRTINPNVKILGCSGHASKRRGCEGAWGRAHTFSAETIYGPGFAEDARADSANRWRSHWHDGGLKRLNYQM